MNCPTCKKPTLLTKRGVGLKCAALGHSAVRAKDRPRVIRANGRTAARKPVRAADGRRIVCAVCGAATKITGGGRVYVHRNMARGRTCAGAGVLVGVRAKGGKV